LEDLAKDINLLLVQYMRALLILSLATLAFFSIYFAVTGVPYALLLASLAAVLEFIPMVGPLTAAIVILLVAGFSGYPHILWILAFLGLYRLFQDYVLQPRLLSAGMELHPLLVVFGVFAGGEIGGIPGTFLSVPILALARVLYRRLAKARHAEELSTIRP
jgi:predicted PurR-regulated permease PerM